MMSDDTLRTTLLLELQEELSVLIDADEPLAGSV